MVNRQLALFGIVSRPICRCHDQRCCPWIPLLKRGLAETFAQCERLLAREVLSVETIPVDGYRSCVCAHLASCEKVVSLPRSGRQSLPKSPSKKTISESLFTGTLKELSASAAGGQKGSRLQDLVVVPAKSASQCTSRGVGSRFSPAMRNRGRRKVAKTVKTATSGIASSQEIQVDDVLNRRGCRERAARLSETSEDGTNAP